MTDSHAEKCTFTVVTHPKSQQQVPPVVPEGARFALGRPHPESQQMSLGLKQGPMANDHLIDHIMLKVCVLMTNWWALLTFGAWARVMVVCYCASCYIPVLYLKTRCH